MQTQNDNWNGHSIRFVEKESSEWWAVAAGIISALDLSNPTMALRRIDAENHTLITIEGINSGINVKKNVVNEFGIYELIFTSRKAEAKEFRKWVFDILKTLRQVSGLEGFQVLCMLDKEHQREAMQRLKEGLACAARVDYIKANTIANKAKSALKG